MLIKYTLDKLNSHNFDYFYRFNSYLKPVLKFIAFAGILLLLESEVAAQFVLVQKKDSTYRLDKQIDVFIDTSRSLSFEQVLQADLNQSFVRRGNLIFGYLQDHIWLKVSLRSDSPNAPWYLEIPAPFLEYVDFYQKSNHQWVHHSSGYFRKQSERLISHTSHVIPVYFSADSTSTVYVSISGSSPKTFPLHVLTRESFIAKTRSEDLGYGVFFGIILVMLGYNLFLYFSLKQLNYLLYVCTIVCTFLIFSSASGYAGMFLWPETPVLNYYAGRLSLGVFTIFLSIFAIRFLEVRQYSKVMYYALLSMIPISIIGTILVATGLLSSAGNNIISITVIIMLTTGIVCRVMGNHTATYFIVAWGIYLVGGLLLTLRNSGVFDYNFWTTHFVEIGATLEATLIALALGARYRRYKEEHEKVQELALKVQQEANERLEQKVKERTQELSSAYEELHSMLETNKEQTRVIENKNAELDAFFYRISHDLRGPISSLLGLTYLAKQEISDPQAKEYIDRQHEQVGRLSHIITGLINLTKLNQSDLQKEAIHFDKLIDECIHSFQELPNFKLIAFKKEIQPDLRYQSEWILMNAILQNLIENGIKYSRKESPFVIIRVYEEGEQLVMQVSDNGQGIHHDHQAKIFEMFYRASNRANGTGLGLYILKRSVDRLGGSIELESKVDEGSTFTVRIPKK